MRIRFSCTLQINSSHLHYKIMEKKKRDVSLPKRFNSEDIKQRD